VNEQERQAAWQAEVDRLGAEYRELLPPGDIRATVSKVVGPEPRGTESNPGSRSQRFSASRC
jgi:hypothetical protein